MRLVVVVPNWNGRAWFDDCFRSLKAQTFSDFSVVIVDNGSTDGSVEEIKRSYPDFKLLEREKNYGFTGGVNPGLEWAIAQGAEFGVLLNNDAVAQPDWLKALIRAADSHPGAGILTSKILYDDGKTIDSTGDFYSTLGFAFPRGRGEIDHGQYDDRGSQEVFAGSGGASLYRTRMLDEIGLFDQDFFAYFEDVDLSFRAQLRGYKVHYAPAAVVHHQVGRTSGGLGDFARYHTFKNVVWLYQKNMPGQLFWKYLPRFLIGQALMAGNDFSKLRFRPFVAAYWVVLLKTFSTIAKRRQIQRSRSVPCSYIDSILYKQMPPTQKSLLRLKKRLLGR